MKINQKFQQNVQKTKEHKLYNLILFESIKKVSINIFIALKFFFIIFILLILIYLSEIYTFKNINKNFLKSNDIISNKYTMNSNNKTIKDVPEFSKFQNMLPRLTPDFKIIPSSIKEIFDARQIYISDIKITNEFIRYIRPVNETEEKGYIKRFSENQTKIDKNIFAKRRDQYKYNEFCKIALNEKLIDDNKIKYDNKPIISIILPSYNKQNILLKSIRSIQNQNFKNIEIIIVNDCSNDNSTNIFNYLLETDPRIRIFHHIINLGLYRSRLDGILYSRGKYIIAFDTGDFYEDNYALLDAYNIMEKYNLDSCKFLFRIITNFSDLTKFNIPYHVGIGGKIKYEPKNIKDFNDKIFKTCGNIWNRLVRANIYIKGLLLLNNLMLNVYKNMWEDIWYNEIVNKVSYSYAIIERVGYVYYVDGQGVGTPKFKTKEQKSNIVKEYVAFLYFDYNFCDDKVCKQSIINKLRNYNEIDSIIQLKNFRSHFEVLNNLLNALIKDRDIKDEDRKYCKNLLFESKIREKLVNDNNFRIK